jgi:ribosomal protein S18 acetylase RimI-like enzyme
LGVIVLLIIEIGFSGEKNMRKMKVKIRITESRNAETIAEINKTVQDIHETEYPEYFKSYDKKAVSEEITKTLDNEDWFSYIAYDNEIPIGYALFYKRQYNENSFRHKYTGIHVDQICVISEYQRRQIGTLLMNKIEEFAVEENVDQIELTYWEKNIHAKKFYEKQGFEETMHFAIKRLK